MTIKMTVRITGMQELRRNLEKITAALISSPEDALKEMAETLIEKTDPDVPVRSGSLRDSHFVGPVERHGSEYSIECGYGRADVVNAKGVATSAYAQKVHEDLTAIHPTGKAKYLEDQLKLMSEDANGIFTKHITGVLKGG